MLKKIKKTGKYLLTTPIPLSKNANLRNRSYSFKSTGYGHNHPREAFSFRSCSIRYGLHNWEPPNYP